MMLFFCAWYIILVGCSSASEEEQDIETAAQTAFTKAQGFYEAEEYERAARMAKSIIIIKIELPPFVLHAQNGTVQSPLYAGGYISFCELKFVQSPPCIFAGDGIE